MSTPWLFALLSRKAISSIAIDYVGQMGSCLPWGRISTIFTISVLRNHRKFIHNFISYNKFSTERVNVVLRRGQVKPALTGFLVTGGSHSGAPQGARFRLELIAVWFLQHGQFSVNTYKRYSIAHLWRPRYPVAHPQRWDIYCNILLQAVISKLPGTLFKMYDMSYYTHSWYSASNIHTVKPLI